MASRLSIRSRIASLTALLFTVILVAAALLFVVQLRSSLYANIEASAERDAEAIQDNIPDAEEWDDDDRFFQVVDDGQLVAWSENVEGFGILNDDRAMLDDDEYLVYFFSEDSRIFSASPACTSGQIEPRNTKLAISNATIVPCPH